MVMKPMTELLLLIFGAALIVVLIGLAIGVAIDRRRCGAVARSGQRAGSTPADHSEVVLPVRDADLDDPAIRRLVDDATRRALYADPEVTTVVVRSLDGVELGRLRRSTPSAPEPFVDVPLPLREPHARHHPGPHDPIELDRAGATPTYARFSSEERPQPHRSLADHFELSDDVRRRIADHEDAVAIVRAILETSGAPIHVDGPVITAYDRIMIVLRTPLYASVGHEDLSAAFLRFQRSGATRGVVVTPGALHHHDIRRREALAPAFRHAGADGIQRMADAVSVGADPWDLVVGAVTVG
jgi:hypothetical protein